jgi:predicted type IV restriction endonuclease
MAQFQCYAGASQMSISRKTSERIAAGLKKYQAILTDAKHRDLSESDTVAIVADMLADVLGYARYTEITRELPIRGTFVDLAVKVGSDTRFLIEVKAIGTELKDNHIRQAIDYGANQGIEWVVLTNGATWRVYKIVFQQPIDKTLVFEIDLASASPRNAETIECIGNLSREGFTQSSMTALLEQKQATSKFSIAAILVCDNVITAARRELRRLFPSIRVEDEQLRSLIQQEVLKRDLIDSDEARAAQKLLKSAARSLARAKTRAAEQSSESDKDSTPVVTE